MRTIALLVLLLLEPARAKYIQQGLVEGYLTEVAYVDRFVFSPSGCRQAAIGNWPIFTSIGGDNYTDYGSGDASDPQVECGMNPEGIPQGTFLFRGYTFMRDHTVFIYKGDAWMKSGRHPHSCDLRLIESEAYFHIKPSEVYGIPQALHTFTVNLSYSTAPEYYFVAVALCAEGHDLDLWNRAQSAGANIEQLRMEYTTQYPSGGLFMYYQMSLVNPGGYW